jgi:uncharacterized membrane protein YkoI
MFSVVRPLAIAVLAAALALPAVAEPSRSSAPSDDGAFVLVQDEGGRWRQRGRGPIEAQERLLPLEAVLGSVAARFPGRHLGVEGPFRRDGRWIYRIKWLTPDGRVLIVFADAQTGQVLGHRG